MPTYNYMDATSLTSSQIASLYLYGTQTPPPGFEERLRPSGDAVTPFDKVVLMVDGGSYMTSGAGRYALVSQSNIAKVLFDGATWEGPGILDNTTKAFFLSEFGGSSVTIQQLVDNYGFTPDFFNLAVSNYNTDVNSADYLERTYVWGQSGFRLGGDTILDFHGPDVVLRNVQVRPYIDNFDYESGSFATQISNYFSDKLVDPYDIGHIVEIEFNADTSPYIATYDATSYANQVSLYSTIHDGSILDGYSSFSTINPQLITNRIAEYVTEESQYVIYGTNGDDTLDENSFDIYDGLTFLEVDNIIVAGGGIDDIYGGRGDDIIYGGAGADTLHGGLGKDTLDGGEDVDEYYIDEHYISMMNTLIDVDGNDNGMVALDGGFSLSDPTWEDVDTIRDSSNLNTITSQVYAEFLAEWLDEPEYIPVQYAMSSLGSLVHTSSTGQAQIYAEYGEEYNDGLSLVYTEIGGFYYSTISGRTAIDVYGDTVFSSSLLCGVVNDGDLYLWTAIVFAGPNALSSGDGYQVASSPLAIIENYTAGSFDFALV